MKGTPPPPSGGWGFSFAPGIIPWYHVVDANKMMAGHPSLAQLIAQLRRVNRFSGGRKKAKKRFKAGRIRADYSLDGQNTPSRYRQWIPTDSNSWTQSMQS